MFMSKRELLNIAQDQQGRELWANTPDRAWDIVATIRRLKPEAKPEILELDERMQQLAQEILAQIEKDKDL